MKRILAVLLFSMCSLAYAGDAGVSEQPQKVYVDSPQVAAPVAPIAVKSVPQTRVSAPAPLAIQEAAPTKVNPWAPGPACAYAPYEVRVEYTPIEPQPGVATYCTCLPYGCPDGSPIVNSCGPCGSCGCNAGLCNPCGNIFTSSQGVVTGVFDAAGKLVGWFVGGVFCACEKGLNGIISTAGNMLGCFVCTNNCTSCSIQ